MSTFDLSAVAKNNGNGTYDAEVYITLYGSDAIPTSSTQNRLVQKGLGSRELALHVAASWIVEHLYPIVKALPKAKP